MSDEELVTFAAEFRQGILDGRPSDLMCYAVSAPLATLLGMYGVENELVETDMADLPFSTHAHWWIRLSDGRALDATADQFNDERKPLPPVYLGKPLDIHAT